MREAVSERGQCVFVGRTLFPGERLVVSQNKCIGLIGSLPMSDGTEQAAAETLCQIQKFP